MSRSARKRKVQPPGASSSGSHSVCVPDRETLFPVHPVMTRDFKIPTPPIQRAFQMMSHTIACGAPGCAFIAFPRFGKTYATKYCQERLQEAFPSVPVIRFHAHNEHVTPRRFYADLLEQSGFGDGRENPRKDVRQQLVRAWWVLAQERKSHAIALLGDEMQAVLADGYSVLIDITNDLHELGVRVIAIFFGQPQLASARAMFQETHRGDILGRFMSRMAAFDGIASPVELADVMSRYDDPEELQYPPDSGCCFTRFFLPQAYAHGWRLAGSAALCWEQFRAQATTHLSSPAKVQKLSVGMEWVAGALQFALGSYGDLDCPDFDISADQWSAAVTSTGFTKSLGLTYDPDWDISL